MDLYIADTNFLGEGYGPKVLIAFMERLQRSYPIKKFIIDPHAENQIAIRTYKEVGFKAVGPQMRSVFLLGHQ